MSGRELHYRWEYNLSASPEKLWPLVADTNRFNRDTGVPSVEPSKTRQRLRNARKRLRLSIYGMAVEWEEQPFEWVRPSRFGVVRTYSKGPMVELRVLAELTPVESGGTKVVYSVAVKPRSWFSSIPIAIQMRFTTARKFAAAFRSYDQMAANETAPSASMEAVDLSPADRHRFRAISEKLVADGAEPEVVARLCQHVQSADEFAAARIRPYQLADEWKASRRSVLEACLRGTRVGLLDLQWELLCPLCRGSQETGASLRDISSQLHCEMCRIDFTVNFDRFVEVTFRPNALLRVVQPQNFCMGSPQKTPHIVAQQLLPAGASRTLDLPLEEGRYRLRALELAGGQDVSVSPEGQAISEVRVSGAGWPSEELRLSARSSLQLQNDTTSEQLFILERLAWSDQSVTAAEITALQIFRDLFATEALRAGEQISVGTLTVLFTDLRNSTQMYKEIGDATAFGLVMNHFDVLKQTIAEEDGALVKTIGDAVMAVFRRPVSALKAMLKAQQILAEPPEGVAPLILKAGIHIGPCIAVTLNDRLDYFGSTVNMAARLEGQSGGSDIIISRALYDDPEVKRLVDSNEFAATRFDIELKGFAHEQFELWRVARRTNEIVAESRG